MASRKATSCLPDPEARGLLTLEKELLLGRRARAGCAEALDELVEANGVFVMKVAWEYRNLGLSLDDLLGEGNVGLMEAARRYDPDRGCKFVTYAMWWIRKSILGALNRNASLLSISNYYRRQLHEIREVDRKLEATLGRRPRLDEIDASLRGFPGRAETLLGRDLRGISLDEEPRMAGGLPLAERVKDPNVANPEEQLIRTQARTAVREAVDELTAKQREVLALRFGLNGQGPLTLTEIGTVMGLSRERIRQIENQGKDRLRRLLIRRARGPVHSGRPGLGMPDSKRIGHRRRAPLSKRPHGSRVAQKERAG